MKKSVSLVLASLMLFSVLALFCGCGGDLPGKWVERDFDYTDKEMYHNMPMELELFSNGTGSARFPTHAGLLDISWTAEGNRIKISTFGSSYSYDFSISGGILTLQYGEHTVTYKNG